MWQWRMLSRNASTLGPSATLIVVSQDSNVALKDAINNYEHSEQTLDINSGFGIFLLFFRRAMALQGPL